MRIFVCVCVYIFHLLFYVMLLLFSLSVISDSLWPHALWHSRLPFPHSLPEFAQIDAHRVDDASNHVIISRSLLCCLQSFPASGCFPMSQLLTSGGQSIGASATVLQMNIRGWFPLGLTDLIPLLFKGLSRVFSNTTVQKHQFFGTQLSSQSNSHIHTWLLEKLFLYYLDLCWQSDIFAF